MNSEHRHTLWLHKIVTFQSTVFADYGALRAARKSFSTLFDGNQTNLLLGAGVRFSLNKLYETCIGIDYSMNPFDPAVRGFTFGFGQFS